MNDFDIDLNNIRKALDELIDQPERSHVILNIGDKFIQFASSKNEELFFSLPSGQFTKEEVLVLTNKLWKKYGILKHTSPLLDFPEGSVTGYLLEFRTWLSRNTYEALRLVEDLLTEGPFDTSKGITIERSWDVTRLNQPKPDQPQPGADSRRGWDSFPRASHDSDPCPPFEGNGSGYDNDPAPSKVLVQGSDCACGQKLPWHLLTLGKLEHKCSCGRVYSSDGTTTRLDR